MKADRKKVKRIMARVHMTVAAVARAAGMPPQTAAAILCGMNVQPDTLIRIARALGVGLADIAQGVVLIPAARAGGESPLEGASPERPAGLPAVDPVRFRAELARSGLTIKGLAELAGVHRGTVSAILRGAEAHRAETVDKLADALGVATQDIVKKEDKT